MKIKFSKKNDFDRRWRSFWRHLWLCAQPFIIAIVAVIFWRWLRSKGYYFCKEDEVVMTGGITATLILAYGITAALVFNSIWEKYKKVMVCVLLQDKQTFLLYRDERMPIIIHLFLFFLSVLLVGMILMLNYQKELSGAVAVFSVSFIITLYWIVMIQLENPEKSPWLAERVPSEWLKEDIDKHFFEENNKKKK